MLPSLPEIPGIIGEASYGGQLAAPHKQGLRECGVRNAAFGKTHAE